MRAGRRSRGQRRPPEAFQAACPWPELSEADFDPLGNQAPLKLGSGAENCKYKGAVSENDLGAAEAAADA